MSISGLIEFRGLLVTDDELAAMRAWVADCAWLDLQGDADVEGLSPHAVLAGVDRHYEGGVYSFLAQLQAELPQP